MNFDDLFRSLRTKEPKIVNDIIDASEKDKDSLNRLIYTTYSGDLLNSLPSCDCGETVGGYNKGQICPKCDTPVQLHIERVIEPIAWIRAPEGVRALINPIVWMMFKKRFTKGGFEVIRWFCDSNYQTKNNTPLFMKEVESWGFPRGLNDFIDNFDAIMAKLLAMRIFREKGVDGDPMEILIRRYRDRIFSQYMPLPNRTLLVVEESNMGNFVDPVMPIAVNAIRIMAGIDASVKPLTTRTKENRTVASIALFGVFYEKYYKEVMAKKEGAFRKHVFGTRNHFSGRAVITSITKAHDYDEVYFPWSIALSIYRIHLVSKLKRRGYGPIEAVTLIDSYSTRFHPLLNELFEELIEESPYPGIPCTIVRHPSLGRGSIQAVFNTRVKVDTGDQTIGLPILITKSMNADFDGDQISVILTLDVMTTEEVQTLAPHMNTFSMSGVRKISNNPAIPKPVVATIANAIHSVHPVDPVRLARMIEVFNL